MGYVCDITKVRQVAKTTNLTEVREKIKSGWMLLEVAQSAPTEVSFVLGQCYDADTSRGKPTE